MSLDSFWKKALIEAKCVDKKNVKKEKVIQKNYTLPSFPRVYMTRREADCVRLLKNKLTNKEIGEILDISTRTVEFYMNNIKMKFQVSKRSELLVLFKDITV